MKYCTNCGLLNIAEAHSASCYDEETGEKLYTVRIYCPNAKRGNNCCDHYAEDIDSNGQLLGKSKFTKKLLMKMYNLQVNE